MNKVIEYLNQQADRINKENARLKAEVERLQRRCDELFMENHRFVERVWLNGYLSGKDDKEVQS
jgi:regulator of replication initiation timing